MVGGGIYTTELWVDPINGSDAPGTPGTAAQPFRTITTALLALPNPPTSFSLIHLNPGVYSPSTNGESFPIIMKEWTDIQGVGAKQVVLRGDQTQTPFMPFYPLCPTGWRLPREILVDFSFLADPDYAEMLDGVTLQGGHVQVYAQAEYVGLLDGRVSNCVFDMLDGHVTDAEGSPTAGPDFGVLAVQTYRAELGYPELRMHLFNNTFVQAWHPQPELATDPAFTAVTDSVAICNVTEPVGDPNPMQRGRARMNVQNNLIRSFGDVSATALLGIDSGDVGASFGTRTGPSNAFDPAAVGGSNGRFCSQIDPLWGAPQPRTTAGSLVLNPNPLTGGVDPAFVGEWLSSTSLVAVPNSHARDWRLLPDSVYADEGTAPAPDALGALRLTAINLTSHVDLACTSSSSFDFDGEGYGNPRLSAAPIRSINGATHPDIGFDETSMLIDGGTVNDTNIHTVSSLPFLGNNPAGLGFHVVIYPDAVPGGGLFPNSHRVAANTLALPPGSPYAAYSVFPTAAYPPVNGLPFDPTLSPPLHWLWIPFCTGCTIVPATNLPSIVFTSPYDGTTHALSYATFASANAGAYSAQQARYKAGSGPNAGLKVMTNLQAIYD